ncbi:hypothetical protein FRACA_1270016 [Frankia canadensis]|uniref:Uncharacterized protein n=1 Tax=Frankia canadensis TaxID=1836972 RepID=A0A2I2KKD2_9ACTN|nr:hypothetical protein FRACA_1270016 [Frankia canadensis]SOU53422.1 hypothetical protein FRACA_1270016 [Frankia canadensis]
MVPVSDSSGGLGAPGPVVCATGRNVPAWQPPRTRPQNTSPWMECRLHGVRWESLCGGLVRAVRVGSGGRVRWWVREGRRGRRPRAMRCRLPATGGDPGDAMFVTFGIGWHVASLRCGVAGSGIADHHQSTA